MHLSAAGRNISQELRIWNRDQYEKNAFLLDPHTKMPNMNLTRVETADIAAYVGTLR
jgi:hypothetical protein